MTRPHKQFPINPKNRIDYYYCFEDNGFHLKNDWMKRISVPPEIFHSIQQQNFSSMPGYCPTMIAIKCILFSFPSLFYIKFFLLFCNMLMRFLNWLRLLVVNLPSKLIKSIENMVLKVFEMTFQCKHCYSIYDDWGLMLRAVLTSF